MKITTDKKETIHWDIDGCSAEAQIDNGLIARVAIQKLVGEDALQSTDERFVRDVYKAIGDLLRHVDAQNNVGRVSGYDGVTVTPTDHASHNRIESGKGTASGPFIISEENEDHY